MTFITESLRSHAGRLLPSLQKSERSIDKIAFSMEANYSFKTSFKTASTASLSTVASSGGREKTLRRHSSKSSSRSTTSLCRSSENEPRPKRIPLAAALSEGYSLRCFGRQAQTSSSTSPRGLSQEALDALCVTEDSSDDEVCQDVLLTPATLRDHRPLRDRRKRSSQCICDGCQRLSR
eukprot:CAMPEP_0178421462 /NCGR_PEP_ID=MMETSP0689_2-20121128/26660_1 /TAXON_ID=160604 /ORGANISM="Amphidinium massartii, Strain CS-259" /LENGTH=178 /DNA_ID=CAMNT_0020042975 /DNA_START=11 /DNA_END=544 /DNA_ORIENTATION=-